MNYSFHCCFGNKDDVYIRMHKMYTLMTEMKSKGLLRICLMLQKPSRKLILLPRHVCFDIISIFRLQKHEKTIITRMCRELYFTNAFHVLE